MTAKMIPTRPIFAETGNLSMITSCTVSAPFEA